MSKMRFTKEIKIALVGVVGIVVCYFGLNFLKGLPIFSTDTIYYITFDDVKGMGVSTPIYADGYQVGVVKGLSYDFRQGGPVKVAASINKDLRIPLGSTAEIDKDLMGNIQINLLLANNPRQRVEVGGSIPGGINAGALGKVQDMIPAIQKMLPKLDSIMTNINLLLANPAIAQSLANIQTVSSNLTVSTRELNTLMASLNRQVPGMMAKADNVLDNTERLTGNLAAIDVQATVDSVNQTLASVNAFTAKLNSDKGTLGLLLNDPSLYHNLNGTISSADSLLIDLKQHPKRYVHFSLFGRKDK